MNRGFTSLISIILPVFNVGKYVDRCLESICKQSYENIEIIFVNDGSDDDSGEIGKAWTRRDSRIIYCEQRNRGQGAARNYGIELAKGEYVMFIDPDDWIEYDCVEILYKALMENSADFCENKYFFKYDQKKGELMQELFVSSNSLCCKLIRRSLLEDNHIRMPELFFEDAATWPIIKIMSSKTIEVERPLYYYRKNTGTSTLDDSNKIKDIPAAMEYMINETKRLGMFDSHYDFILEEADKHLKSCLGRAINELDRTEYERLYRIIQGIRNKYLGQDEMTGVGTERFWIFGSYNLSRIVSFLTKDTYKLQTKDLPFFFSFSSVISVMSRNASPLNGIVHDNIVRQDALKKDFQKELKKIKVLEDDYILVDFLEERYGVIKTEPGYITYSDVLRESLFSIESEQIIEADSTEYFELWKTNCDLFIDFLKDNFDESKIILCENYLAPEVVSSAVPIKVDTMHIKKENDILAQYYDYFKKRFTYIKTIRVPAKLNFTDGASKYGIGPHYLNFHAHQKMASSIRAYIDGTENENKVSVIMPAYNGERYISGAIESILNQTYDNFELLIIDDCSTDNTMEIVKKYKDDRIRIISNERNMGIAFSRNVGLEKSVGNYVAIMDDDDISLPERLEKEVGYLEKHPQIDVVGGRYDVIDECNRFLYHETFSLHNPKYIKAVLLFRNVYGSSTVMIRKKIIDDFKLRFRDGALGMEDFYFWMECSKVANLTTIDDVVLQYRKSSLNESSRVLTQMNEKRKEVFAYIQSESLRLSGFRLSKQQIKILTKVVPEFIGGCMSSEELLLFYEALKEIVMQAYEMKLDYCQELEIYMKKVLIQGIEHSSNNLLWT